MATTLCLCALNPFLGWDSELQTYHGQFSTDNKHRKLLVTEQSKGRKFISNACILFDIYLILLQPSAHLTRRKINAASGSGHR